jgi:small ubiquitin-related modifier
VSVPVRTASARERVTSIDLSPLKARLVRQAVLPASHAQEAVDAYRQFLELKIVLCDQGAHQLSPPLPVRKVWQAHILDTRGYVDACRRLLGRAGEILHHDADLDLDATAQAYRVNQTRMAYTARFGSAPTSWAWDFGPEFAVVPALVVAPPPRASVSLAPRARPQPVHTSATASVHLALPSPDGPPKGKGESDAGAPVLSTPALQLSPPTSHRACDEQQSLAKLITVSIFRADGHQHFFNLGTRTPLGKLFNAFCKGQGVRPQSCMFLFDGTRVYPDRTPEDHKMANGDVIDVVIQQE